MPLTVVQIEILKLLAANRSPESYVAGGTLSGRKSSRISSDIDLFHSGGDITLQSFDSDREILVLNGFSVEPQMRPRPGFVRAVVTARSGEKLRMDWAHESSFRFFPVIQDDLTGWELHWADAATNKVLAAAGRDKPRDAFDLLYWHNNPLSLGALVWAAVGKDPGFSPDLLIDEISRNARLSPSDLEQLRIEGEIDPVDIAQRFRKACQEARDLARALPIETIGKLFLDASGQPVEPDPSRPETLERPHEGSERGCWPSFVPSDPHPSP